MKGTITCSKLIWRISKQQLGKNSIIGSCKSRRLEWKDRWGGQARHVAADNHKGETGHKFLSRNNIYPALQEHGLSIVHPYLGAILEGESPLSPVVHDCDAVQVLHPRRLKTPFMVKLV